MITSGNALSSRAAKSWARAVGSYVPGLTQKAFQKFGFSAATMLMEWAEIVGQETARVTRPEKLKWPRANAAIVEGDEVTVEQAGRRTGATIVLRVEPACALDIQYQAAQIIERINAYFGYNAVSQIRLLQVPIECDEPRGACDNRQPKQLAAAARKAFSEDVGSGNRLDAALARLRQNVESEAGRD